MAKTTEKHVISDELRIYKTESSRNWTARFKIGKAWLGKTTSEQDREKAIIKAIQLQAEYKTKAALGYPVHTGANSKANTIKVIARKAIKRMETETANGTGKPVFNDYILVLNRYHIEYFDNTSIKDIDVQALMDFDKWRIDELGRVPAKSTISTHNSALQRVFDEAVIAKLITATELPVLKNEGRAGERRAYFTRDEYQFVLEAAKNWIAAGRKQVTKDTRTLLYYYIQFAVLTGIRPGKEIEYLTWGDMYDEMIFGKQRTFVIVRKGKTTLYTGPRKVHCKHRANEVLDGVKATLENAEKDDLIFSLPNGKSTKQISRYFSDLLAECGLEYGADGKRTLYSLRHTYITWERVKKTDVTVIATQCGTSVEMIERFYSHLDSSMFVEELSDNDVSLDLTNSTDAAIFDYIDKDDEGILVIKDGGSQE